MKNATAYYHDRQSDTHWPVFCAPGDDGYPSRCVAVFRTEALARRCADRLSELTRINGAQGARDCEQTVALLTQVYAERSVSA